MAEELKPLAAPNWQANLNHPNLNARLALQPTRESAAGDAAQPVQLSLEMSSNHPVIQSLLQELGPLLAKFLPILFAGLLGGESATQTSS